MASAGAAITMQTFLASSAKHDEPLNANRLRNHDKRMCDELEIKSLLPNGEHHHRSMSNSLLHSPGGVGQAFGFSLGDAVSPL
uniref:Uncharacterized protein n=1 Tax=Panagrolaimus sp. PS1159 TaxID=55785 RepID=A0AC35FUD4_9BILA